MPIDRSDPLETWHEGYTHGWEEAFKWVWFWFVITGILLVIVIELIILLVITH